MAQLNLYPNASTIDAVNDELVIWTNSLSAVQNINRNTFLNLSSQPVGLSDSQTLTNKTLTSPTVSGPTLSGTLTGTYTIGGTPTFPSTVTQNTASQTLTNKTLTSPTINSPTITNATISADTLTGYTTSNTGTIYGVPVTTGTISGTYLTSGTVTSTQIATNGVSAANLATSAITLGYAQVATGTAFTTASTIPVAVTGLTVNVTIPAGGRKVKVTVYTYYLINSSGVNGSFLGIYSGASSGLLTTQLQTAEITTGVAGAFGMATTVVSVTTPSAGSIWFTAAHWVTGGNGTVSNTSNAPAFILVEAI